MSTLRWKILLFIVFDRRVEIVDDGRSSLAWHNRQNTRSLRLSSSSSTLGGLAAWKVQINAFGSSCRRWLILANDDDDDDFVYTKYEDGVISLAVLCCVDIK